MKILGNYINLSLRQV